MIVVGAIIPHAPLLRLPRPVADPARAEVDRIRNAVAALSLESCDAAVILSPHGHEAGVYRHVSGSFDGFGVPGFDVSAQESTELAAEFAATWNQPLLDGPVDHGITGVLVGRTTRRVPVVAVTFPGITGPAPASNTTAVIDAAAQCARALKVVAGHRSLAVIASAHTSAALTPRAPLMDRPEGHELDARILKALEADVGNLTHIEPGLWEAAGSCGAAPLTIMGTLFAARRAEILAYGAPAGVGYLVARMAG